jgi:tRNA threonylcarbamoyladenosine biosynthesis protein TsaE
VTVYHVDLYRLETAAQVESLGLDDIFAQPAAVLLEWAERFPSILPQSRVEIRIAPAPDRRNPERRRIEVQELEG